MLDILNKDLADFITHRKPLPVPKLDRMANPWLDNFTITVPGKTWEGRVHGTPRRPHGRRILVVDTTTGETVFDTGDQYDLGNARNSLETYLAWVRS